MNGKGDWEHRGSYSYARTVISDIIDLINGDKCSTGNPYIIMKPNAKDKRFYYLSFHSSARFIIPDLNDLLDKLTASNFADLNKILGELNPSDYTIYDDPEMTNKSSYQNIRRLWGKIYKGVYSNHTSGQSSGEIFESLICYLYNIDANNIPETDDPVDSWVQIFDVQDNITGFDSWIQSSYNTVDIIRDIFGDDYVACHLNGKDALSGGYKKFIDIEKIFSGKNGIRQILGNGYNDIYPGTKKDKWNPADIILIKKDLDIDKLLRELRNKTMIPDGQALNVKLASLAASKDIIPISLKNISSGGHLYAHNIDDSNAIADKYNIVSMKIDIPKRLEINKLSGSLWIHGISEDNEDCTIQLRAQSDSSSSGQNLSVEAGISGNRGARGGKGISVIKRALNIKDNSYYADLSDNEDIIEFLDNNFRGMYDPATLNTISKKYKDLYKRICFRGFIGLYNLWVSQNHNIKDPQIEFTKFLWASCVDCPGAYYIIK